MDTLLGAHQVGIQQQIQVDTGYIHLHLREHYQFRVLSQWKYLLLVVVVPQYIVEKLVVVQLMTAPAVAEAVVG
jgi:hypothetical protein